MRRAFDRERRFVLHPPRCHVPPNYVKTITGFPCASRYTEGMSAIGREDSRKPAGHHNEGERGKSPRPKE